MRRNWQRRKVMLESQVHAQSGSMSTPAEGPIPQVLDRTVSSTTTSRPLVIVKALRSAAAMGPRREQAARAGWEVGRKGAVLTVVVEHNAGDVDVADGV